MSCAMLSLLVDGQWLAAGTPETALLITLAVILAGLLWSYALNHRARSAVIEAGNDDGSVRALHFHLMGSIPEPMGKRVVAQIRRHVPVPCVLREERRQDLPLLADREQVDADSLLQSLEAIDPEDGVVHVGLTDRDLGTRMFTYVFGQAKQGGRAALVSVKRLDPQSYGLWPSAAVVMRRVVREVLHELGHVSGLGHCKDCSCLMYFVATADSIDVRGESLCPACQGQETRGLRILPA
jgi:archaemetzincin